jgi:hypothetical protein
VRLYHFTTAGAAQLIKDYGDWGITISIPWLGRSVSGVDLADGTKGDAYSSDTGWVVVVEIDEPTVAQYEVPRTPIFRDLFKRLWPRRQREWIVPQEVLNEKGRVIQVYEFSREPRAPS